MILHRNLVFAVVDTLHLIFNEERYADKEISLTLKRDKRWGARDRNFIAETTYEIVRWKRLYTSIAEVKAPFSREELFKVFAVWATLKGIKLPEWPQFENTPTRRIKGKFDTLSKERVYRESIPNWLDELGVKELGEKKWEKEIEAQNQQADVILRANTLKITVPQLKKALEQEAIYTKTSKKYPSALILEKRANVFQTQAFKKGYFEVQDASSQLVAPFLAIEPGMRIVDTCAGAGGKTLHLAALSENKGQIIALDIYAGKLRELKRRAKRAGAHNVETRHIDSTKVIKKLHNSADRVLIDAPCSGLGVLKRNPDSKWKLTEEFVENIKKTQAEILEQYSKILRKDGLLVYATCSVLPSENFLQIEKFLTTEQGKKFKFIKDQSILASETGFDGFYMALLKRVE
ncbi:MAG: RsmB/NOP family class I SAM-dependent RNA methyltransferase [Mesonia hippocampi]|uniref:RsmB/NOP family class I SAM-dependent RNA methyltransferase n=1 Tax=Mesonia hippocampi TaxID=1628250 RepID=UPI003F9E7437